MDYIREVEREQEIKDTCKNCGHDKSHHHRLNDKLDLCDAVLKRVPLTYCMCRKFERRSDA